MTMLRSRWAKAAVAGAAAALTLPLAACSGDGEAQAAGGSATIRFNWWGSDIRARNQQEFITLCEAEVPGLDVLGETASWGDYTTRLSTQSAANDLPDVFTVIDPFMYEFMDNGDFLDLRTVSEDLDLSAFPESTFGDVTGPDGEIFGVSMGHSGTGVVINPEVFERYGVALPDDETWTWDDFRDIAVQISEASGGETVGASIPMFGDAMQVWLRQRGLTFSQMEDAPFSATEDVVAEYFEFVRSLIDAGATESPSQAAEQWAAQGSPEQSSFAQGRVGMQIMSTNQLGQFEAAAGHELLPVLWPGESEQHRGAWIKEGTWLVINSNTQHPEMAARLVDCLVNNVEGAKIMGLDRGIPANADVAAALREDLDGADLRFAEWVQGMLDNQETPWSRWNLGVAPLYEEEFARANERNMFAEGTPLEIATAFVGTLRNAATD